MFGKFVLSFTEHARKDLISIQKKDADLILNKLERYTNQANPIKNARKLTDSRFGEYRFRVGNYRVIFDLISGKKINILLILTIKNRKDAYENL